MADFWAAPGATGSGADFSNPGKVSTGITTIGNGDTLWLKDGTYTGADYMINIASVSGTVGSRKAIKAINEGSVLIDGGGSLETCRIADSDYWDIWGLNVTNNDGNNALCYFTRSSYCTFKRICAWDNPSGANAAHFLIGRTTGSGAMAKGNLIEDCCGFGIGRKSFIHIQNEPGTGTDRNILRRYYGTWYASSNASLPRIIIDSVYDSRGLIIENVLASWRQATASGSPYGAGLKSAGLNAVADPNDREANINWYGCISYMPTGVTYDGAQYMLSSLVNDQHMTDCVSFVPSDHSGIVNFTVTNSKIDDGSGTDSSPQTNSLTNLSLIGGASNSISSGWAQTNVKTGAAVSDVYTGGDTVYVNNGSKGATIRYRTESGSLTGTALWPWPMNSRILAAMALSSYTPIDVTSEIYTIFGTSPDDGGGGSVAPTVGTTTGITSISTTSASSGGNVTSDGGASVTARGVCWSLSPSPTTSDSHTTDGTGTGIFTSSITGLTNGKHYYVRAYATNSIGTSYGPEKLFSSTNRASSAFVAA